MIPDDNRYAFAGKVVTFEPVIFKILKVLFDLFRLAVTLIFDLLTSKSNQIIFVPKSTKL